MVKKITNREILEMKCLEMGVNPDVFWENVKSCDDTEIVEHELQFLVMIQDFENLINKYV